MMTLQQQLEEIRQLPETVGKGGRQYVETWIIIRGKRATRQRWARIRVVAVAGAEAAGWLALAVGMCWIFK